MSRFLRIVFKVVGWLLLAFLLGFLIYYVWIYLSSDREKISENYIALAEEKVEKGDAEGIWELAKAYMIGGIDRSEYEKKEGVYLARLDDKRAEKILSDLIEEGNVSDEVWYQYGLILMNEKEFERAEYVFNQISDAVNDVDRASVLSNLAYIEGIKGNWDGVGQLLERLDDMTVKDNFGIKLQQAYSLFDGEITTEYLDIEQVQRLNKAMGDAFVLEVANVWLDMGLTDWGRVLMFDSYYASKDKIDFNILYAKSYLIDGDCLMAEKVLAELNELIGKDERVVDIESQLKSCWVD